MKILLLDNYDSFTYNLLHVVKELGYTDIEVFRNDRISLDEVNRFDKIILSPGPGIPAEAGLLLPIIKQYAPTKSILGVCLGHQAIGEAFGATLENLVEVYHGVQTLIDNHGITPLHVRCTWHTVPSRISTHTTRKDYHPQFLKSINV